MDKHCTLHNKERPDGRGGVHAGSIERLQGSVKHSLAILLLNVFHCIQGQQVRGH